MKNIVFDIGNVLVKWSPMDIIKSVFPDQSDPKDLVEKFFKAPVFYDLNLGTVTEKDAIKIYSRDLNLPLHIVENVLAEAKNSLTPVEGGFELLEDAYHAGIPLYCITDNVHEFVQHLKERYTFFNKFKGVIISAEVGILKPSEKIYRCLIDQYDLNPRETVFIDDLAQNTEGAKKVGMQSIQFIDAKDCRQKLIELGFTQLS
ncbi:HAD family hydrolase [Candidatus Finniella inopinata]|uniref:HAD family phosphatase n=1 Tax=Candidatus Finniella inopinata TaxID=1696036 RepID=A0A4Q7DL64_9PROT|nr:HAD family phosphatase [Candidatus Finniella inopinata]RZI47140.1 HAD family phosphatase [Candidatus Finniella inopinata]